jgi:hypothetical protein
MADTGSELERYEAELRKKYDSQYKKEKSKKEKILEKVKADHHHAHEHEAAKKKREAKQQEAKEKQHKLAVKKKKATLEKKKAMDAADKTEKTEKAHHAKLLKSLEAEIWKEIELEVVEVCVEVAADYQKDNHRHFHIPHPKGPHIHAPDIHIPRSSRPPGAPGQHFHPKLEAKVCLFRGEEGGSKLSVQTCVSGGGMCSGGMRGGEGCGGGGCGGGECVCVVPPAVGFWRHFTHSPHTSPRPYPSLTGRQKGGTSRGGIPTRG